jgi:hypothetical protein
VGDWWAKRVVWTFVFVVPESEGIWMGGVGGELSVVCHHLGSMAADMGR